MYSLNVLVLYRCYSCVGTIQSDVNCTSKWVLQSRSGRAVTTSSDRTYHRGASGRGDCQKACEFDPRCVAVDWYSYEAELPWHLQMDCYLNTKPNHNHSSPSECIVPDYTEPTMNWYHICWSHYELVSRCSITPGQCFDSNVVANMNLLKTN